MGILVSVRWFLFFYCIIFIHAFPWSVRFLISSVHSTCMFGTSITVQNQARILNFTPGVHVLRACLLLDSLYLWITSWYMLGVLCLASRVLHGDSGWDTCDWNIGNLAALLRPDGVFAWLWHWLLFRQDPLFRNSWPVRLLPCSIWVTNEGKAPRFYHAAVFTDLSIKLQAFCLLLFSNEQHIKKALQFF